MNETALGTARWATQEELYETRHIPGRSGKDADFLVGAAELKVNYGIFDTRTEVHLIAGKTDQHALVCMGARGGKGTSVLVPNLIEWRGSCVVIDPKGENATLTASRRGSGSDYAEGLGQKVIILDPFQVATVDESLRATLNPLSAIQADDDNAIDEAGRIADAIVVHEDAKDAHWNESARYLIKGMILHVLTAPEFEGQRNLISVRNLLVRGDWLGMEEIRAANQEREAAGEESIFEPDPFDLLWLGMIENAACDSVIAGVGQGFKSMAEKERDSVLSTAKRHTEFIDSPPMRRSLQSSDFDLSELKTNPDGVSLFLSLPTRHMGTQYRWLRMLVTLILDEMEKIAHQPKSGYPVLMVLDEFPGLGRMKRIEEATSQIPGYGVKLVFVCQSLSQLKDIYKDNWETFVACCGVSVFAANQDELTLRYLSRRLGQTEIVRTVSSSSERGAFEPSAQTRSEQLHKRSLLTEDEIAQTFSADKNYLLAFIAGFYPMHLVKLLYFHVPYFAGKYDPHPDHPPPEKLIEDVAETSKTEPKAPVEEEEKKEKSKFRRGVELLFAAIILIAIIGGISEKIGQIFN